MKTYIFSKKSDREQEPVRRHLSGESGIVLATALVLLLVLTLLAAVTTQWSATDLKRTKNYKNTRQAFFIAEAGIQMALQRLNYDASGASPGEEIADNGFNTVLDSSVGLMANHGSDLTNVSFGGGTYNVTLVDNDDYDGSLTADADNTLLLTSEGTASDGTTKVTLEALIHRPLYQADSAITTQGDLNGSGGITINGTNGSIHSNTSISISGGSASITQGATATGTCSGTGCIAGGVAPEAIPIINPSDYEAYATYILNGDGTITDQANSKTYTYSNAGGGHWTSAGEATGDGDSLFLGISQNPDYWYINSNSNVADGFYYAKAGSGEDGNIKISSTPDPWTTTILADGYIDFGGGGTIVNFTSNDPAHTDDIDNIFLVAGTDLEFSGNPSNTIQGIMACKEQMKVTGTVSLNGFVVVSDSAADDSKVTANEISGNMTITYNGNVTAPFLSNKVILLSWQQV